MKDVISRFKALPWWQKPFAAGGLLGLAAVVVMISPLIIIISCGVLAGKVLHGEDNYPSY